MAEQKRIELETAKGVLQVKIDHEQRRLEKFKAHFEEHGPRVFESCDSALEAGAATIIYERVLGAINYIGEGRAAGA